MAKQTVGGIWETRDVPNTGRKEISPSTVSNTLSPKAKTSFWIPQRWLICVTRTSCVNPKPQPNIADHRNMFFSATFLKYALYKTTPASAATARASAIFP